MTGEENKKKNKNGKKTSYIYLLLLLILIVPTSIMVILLIQNISMKNNLASMKQEIYSYERNIEDMQVTVNELSTAVLQKQATVDETSDELLSEDSLDTDEEDVNEIESKVVWDADEQTATAWDSNSGIRKVYLTFDDGPSSNTDKILDILDEYGVKATFFVVGKEGYNEQYQRIVEDGHTLGMHSFSHKYGEIYQSVDSYKKDFYKLHDFLYEVTGVDTTIARFPGGSSNTVSRVNMKDLIAFLNEEGVIYFDWNVSSGDATSNYVSADTIKANVLSNVWKYDSVVILFHDASSKGTTVQALPDIIESILASDNTVLLPITEDTIPVQHISAECQ